MISSFGVPDLKFLEKLQPPGWSSLLETFKYYLSSSFCFPIKASVAGELVGVGAAITYGDTAWLAHIIVEQNSRQRGIGRSLVDYLLDYLNEAGFSTIFFLATELGYGVYRRAGFKEQGVYVALMRTKEIKTSLQVDDKIQSLQEIDYEEVLTLDKYITGEDRTRLLLDHFPGGFVYKEDEQILGYYLKELGEGLILARDLRAGKGLIDLRNRFTNIVTLPLANLEGLAYYESIGFQEIRRVTRMIKGPEFIWHPKQVFSRAGGNFG